MASSLPIYIELNETNKEIGSASTFSFFTGSDSPIKQMYIMTSRGKENIEIQETEYAHEFYKEENCALGSFTLNPFDYLENRIILKLVVQDENNRAVAKTIVLNKKSSIKGFYFGITKETDKEELCFDHMIEGYFFDSEEENEEEDIEKTIELKVNGEIFSAEYAFDEITNNINLKIPENVTTPHFSLHIPKDIKEEDLSIDIILTSKTTNKILNTYTHSFQLHNAPVNNEAVLTIDEEQEIEDTMDIVGYCTGDSIPENIVVTVGGEEGITSTVNVGIERLDVYPYLSSNRYCGFETTIDVSDLAPGEFLVNVIDGQSFSLRVQADSNFKVYKKKEPWIKKPESNDVLSRIDFLNELKENMAKIIEDYKGRGVENEDQLIAKVKKMFTGYIIPSRDDWDTLEEVLNHLATIKELGNAYEYFISDLEDGLGLSDIYAIRDFINYVQTLGPKSPFLSINLPNPPMYYPINVKAKNNGDSTYMDITWDKSSIVKPKAKLTYTPSITEDIHDYKVSWKIESKTESYTGLISGKETWTIPVDWQNWTSDKDKTYGMHAEAIDIDKRGNASEPFVFDKVYPNSTKIPRGVKRSIVEYNLNSEGWKPLTKTTAYSYRHQLPYPINGNIKYRVRFEDKTSGLKSKWVNSPSYKVKKYPPKPAKPSPKAKTSYYHADITWKAIKHADYYDVWVGSESKAKKNNGHYFGKVTKLKQRITNLKENTNYTFYVRAVNVSGKAVGNCKAKTKQKTPKTKTYNSKGVKTWRTRWRFKNYYGWIGPWHKKGWRRENEVIQGEWVDYYPIGWAFRTGGSYWSWHDQKWGYHTGYVTFDYKKIRKDMKGKNIQSATIILRRFGTNHGWQSGMPIHWVSHKAKNAKKTGGKPGITGRLKSNVSIDRNGTATVTDRNTKTLAKRIINGSATGFGLDKNYKGKHTRMDKAYMRFKPNVTLKIKYKD